jgi:putative transposase
MPPGPKAEPIVLTSAERRELESMTRRAKAEQSAALRARIILAAASGETNTTIASRLQVRRLTVVKWRARFLEQRCEGLLESSITVHELLRRDTRPNAVRQGLVGGHR